MPLTGDRLAAATETAGAAHCRRSVKEIAGSRDGAEGTGLSGEKRRRRDSNPRERLVPL
jgi:hypothetical protein